MAAHLEPEILLVDEVLSVGDAAFQKKCLDKIGDSRKGRADGTFHKPQYDCRKQPVQAGDLGEMRQDCRRRTVGRYRDKVSGKVCRRALDLSEEVWDELDEAPGNDMVRLHRVRVRRQDGLSDPLTMQTPFQVEVEYWNLVNQMRICI